MIKKYLTYIRQLYFKIINSIAFYPSLIGSIFLAFAAFMMWIEYTEPLIAFKEDISYLLVADKDTAKSVLTTLVASLISLTVFSFSMVMVVLNTASANLSPRVLPGLVSKKSHQIVLGFYLGSISYCLLLIINVQKEAENYRTPTLGVLMAMLFGIICLALFVYFIESISRTIQTDNVLNQIYKQTREDLEALGHEETKVELPEMSDWVNICSDQNGYYKSVAKKRLTRLLDKHDLKAYIRVPKGFFIVKGYPLLAISRDVSADKELVAEILSYFTFFVEEYTTDHYSYGFRQISQIAIKALSPGINDPGTAIRAVDMLSILFIAKTALLDFGYYQDESKSPTLFYREHSFSDLFFEMLTPIRHYGHADILVMINLLEACKNILYSNLHKEDHLAAIQEFIQAIIEDSETHITNKSERKQLQDSLSSLKEISPFKTDTIT